MAIVTKASSKVAGMVKGAGAALEGYPGIFHHLVGEHAEVATLMERIADSSGDSSVRDELFPEIRTSLLAHARGEEEEFYPQLREYAELEPLVAQSLDEHAQIEVLLEDLHGGDKSTDAWMMRFEELQQQVEAHVAFEENELFPLANEVLSNDAADEMLSRYETVEEREKEALAH
jgi:hemerythrin superfamily protein